MALEYTIQFRVLTFKYERKDYLKYTFIGKKCKQVGYTTEVLPGILVFNCIIYISVDES